MARAARSDEFDPYEVSVFHCINRCVRRCFLCGVDPLTGEDFEHRKAWIEKRLEFLAAHFGIDVIGFSVLSNHFHVVLRNRPDVVATWSDEEVARRWRMLCPLRKQPDGTPQSPTQDEIQAIVSDPDRVKELRTRLSHISWFMKMVSERVARRANAEEDVTGRFWQGRFRGIKLADAAAILACLMYVDLNPIRAGICDTPEQSEHTSAKHRIDQHRNLEAHAADWLAPLTIDELALPGPSPSSLSSRCSDKGVLPISLEDYLMLLDWTGRQVAQGTSGSVPEHLAPILIRLGIDTAHWTTLSTRFGELFCRVAGSPSTLAAAAARKGHRWYQAPGAPLLSAAAA